jgi:hypothetical protein
MRAHRALLVVVVAAFLIRFGYDLFIHPPLSFTHSDMGGYLRRGNLVIDHPWGYRDPRLTFFPFGTHGMVAAVKTVFGRNSNFGFALVLSALGAATAGYWFATAARLFGERKRLLAVLGVLFVLDVPLLFIGGFVLSEVPFSACLAAATFHAMRWLDDGRPRDALATGVAFALAITFRPQVVLSFALIGLLLLVHRGRAKVLTRRSVALVLAPVLVVSILSVVRVHHHTGQLAFVSTNGPFNVAFGRCHCRALTATKPTKATYEPPSFVRLDDFEKKHDHRPIVGLDPAAGREIFLPSELWDQKAAWELSKRCIEITGPLRQVKYAATHVLLLWGYNLPWPTTGPISDVWAVLQGLLVPGLLVAMFRVVRRRLVREGILVAHVVALLVTAMAVFGEARLRAPYDGFLMMLALWVYAPLADRLWKRIRRIR